jgi:hypothetical protein
VLFRVGQRLCCLLDQAQVTKEQLLEMSYGQQWYRHGVCWCSGCPPDELLGCFLLLLWSCLSISACLPATACCVLLFSCTAVAAAVVSP